MAFALALASLLVAAARGGDSRDCAVCEPMRNCSRCAIGAPLVADHGWAQVTRVRARCVIAHGNAHELAGFLDTYAEGRSAGWPSDAGARAYAFSPDGASAARLWPYGVFFFLNVASGAFVNMRLPEALESSVLDADALRHVREGTLELLGARFGRAVRF